MVNSHQLRLATFNLLHGKSLSDDKVDINRYALAVKNLDVDVLGLQEVDCNQPRSKSMDMAAVAVEAMSCTDYRYTPTMVGLPGLWSPVKGPLAYGAASYGIALISKYPVLYWNEIKLPQLYGKIPVIFSGKRKIVLVRDEPRVAIVAVIDSPAGVITVVNTHLSLIPGLNTAQLRYIKRITSSLPQPLILMGDFNLNDARPAKAVKMTPLVTALTNRLDNPDCQIDHIMGSSGVVAVDSGSAITTGISDHKALMVSVRINS